MPIYRPRRNKKPKFNDDFLFLLVIYLILLLGFVCYDFYDLFVRIFEIYRLGFSVDAYK